MGVVVKVDPVKCNLCKLCVKYCPAGVFALRNNHIEVSSTSCIECYGCIPLCPLQAISIEVLENTIVDFALYEQG